VLWNNLDGGLFGAQARCKKVVEPLENVLGENINNSHFFIITAFIESKANRFMYFHVRNFREFREWASNSRN